MSTDTLELDATDPHAGVHSLSRKQVLSVLKLKQIRPDATQQEIATFVGCSQRTVSAWLADYRDSVAEAGDYLKASALPAAVGLVELTQDENAKIRLDANKAILQANKLLGNEEKTQVIGIQVVLGFTQQP